MSIGREELSKYLATRLGSSVELMRFKSLSGGACQDNYLVDLVVDQGDFKGRHEMVMRTDKGGALFSSLSRIDEYHVCKAAHDAGVATPAPCLLEKDSNILGHPFYFLQRISGKAGGRFIVKDRSIAKYRKSGLAIDLAKNLARIHGIHPPKNKNDLTGALGMPSISIQKNLASISIQAIRKLLKSIDEAHPAIELCLNWLTNNQPECDQLVLVHGDFRTGNFMVCEDGLNGILDWEFAHWGDRHEDISWLCMRDWRFGKHNKEVGGFADRPEFYEAYEKASGISVDQKSVLFWEIIGNLRWAIGSIQQTERHLSGKDKGIELAAIGRRACEMEYEAMRLIENAR